MIESFIKVVMEISFMGRLSHKEIGDKWQKKWEEEGIFEFDENVEKPKFYVLDMFPYPSGELHCGHLRNYCLGDLMARYYRMKGYNVFFPFGFDAFGLPAENAAIKHGIHPKEWTYNNIENIRNGIKKFGYSCSWKNEIITCSPEYYKWNQYIFLKFYENGLAYRKKSPVNWCPSCKTVLANEQVVNGECERCGSEVELRELEQWFFKITEFADELYEDINLLEHWPETVKIMQRNWIGKSKGALVRFKLDGFEINGKDYIEVFTTRVDTLMGVTFLVISPESKYISHIIDKLSEEEKRDIEEGLKILKRDVVKDKFAEKEKKGVFLKRFAIHPITGDKIPIFVANYVLESYGTGFVMGVPAHDERDYEFAKKYSLPIKEVIAREFGEMKDGEIKVRKNVMVVYDKGSNKLGIFISEEDTKDINEIARLGLGTIFAHYENYFAELKCYLLIAENSGLDLKSYKELHKELKSEYKKFVLEKAKNELVKQGLISGVVSKALDFFTGEGILINSGVFSYLKSRDAKEKIVDFLKSKGLGDESIQFRLKDWCISRQRYWGTPIPIVYCEKCGVVPEKYENLPIELPEDVEFIGEDNPIKSSPTFVNCKCPKCGRPARRETDTMDTFVDSSWYFLRYVDNKNDSEIFDNDKVEKLLPVDQYTGGVEHAVLHLLYARFFTKALHKVGILGRDLREPFVRLLNQGMVLNQGQKMSKSKGNGINPLEMIEKYGTDVTRLFILTAAAPQSELDWTDKGLVGAKVFIDEFIGFYDTLSVASINSLKDEYFKGAVTELVKGMEEDFAKYRFNYAFVRCKLFFEEFKKYYMFVSPEVRKEIYEILVKVLMPYIPHTCEEIWQMLGYNGFVSLESWPEIGYMVDERIVKEHRILQEILRRINKIKEQRKLNKVTKVTLVQASDLRFRIFDELNGLLAKTRDYKIIFDELMKHEEFRQETKFITKFLPKTLGDGLITYIGDFETERKSLEKIKVILEALLNCYVDIKKIDEIDVKVNALPGSPGVIVE